MSSAFRVVRGGGSWPRIFAHRGASGHAPENTLLAAHIGFQHGADAWELDTQLSRDGVPVVLHDHSLRRTTDVESRFPLDERRELGFLVRDFDWAEIQTLDAGAWNARFAARGESLTPVRVPSLEDALAFTGEQGWLVNVELKADDRPFEPLLEAVFRLVDRHSLADRVLISSFDHEAVRASASRRPEIASAALVHENVEQVDWSALRRQGIDFLHVSVESLGLSESSDSKEATRLVRAIQKVGLGVQVYTVNDARPGGQAEALARMGVEGLFMDDPAQFRWLFESLDQQSAQIRRVG